MTLGQRRNLNRLGVVETLELSRTDINITHKTPSNMTTPQHDDPAQVLQWFGEEARDCAAPIYQIRAQLELVPAREVCILLSIDDFDF